MRTSTLRSLAAVAALATFSACTDNTSPGPLATGNYELQTVNGAGLPYTYSIGGTNTVTIENDVYTLNSDGTYSETINETLSNGVSTTPATDGESGTWAQSGTNTVLFAPSYSTQGNYTQYAGSLSGNTLSNTTLTFSYNGVVWIYAHD